MYEICRVYWDVCEFWGVFEVDFIVVEEGVFCFWFFGVGFCYVGLFLRSFLVVFGSYCYGVGIGLYLLGFWKWFLFGVFVVVCVDFGVCVLWGLWCG